MTQPVTPKGPLAHPDILRALLGHDAVLPLTGQAADTLAYFEQALGTTPDAAEADADLPRPAVLIHAAREVAGYYGRLSAGTVAGRMPMILARAASKATAAESPAPATIRSATSADRVDVVSREASHEGHFLTQTFELRHPGFRGGMSDILRREVFVATDAAIVLPYDPLRDRVLLVEQFRMGPFGRGDPYPWVLEPVAGRVDAGETPDACARRECVEEAHLTLHGIEHVSSHYCTPGCSTEMFHCYVGLCDLPELARGLGGLETENEDIRTHVLSFEAGMDLVRTGEANIGPMILLFLWLERERARLRGAA